MRYSELLFYASGIKLRSNDNFLNQLEPSVATPSVTETSVKLLQSEKQKTLSSTSNHQIFPTILQSMISPMLDACTIRNMIL